METKPPRTPAPPPVRPQGQLLLEASEPLSPIFRAGKAHLEGFQHRNTPSAWFARRFPKQAEIYGPPILELQYTDTTGMERIRPVSPNVDFFAAILGGEEKYGHKVVYLTQESAWYFYDPRLKAFATTTEEKLKVLLSQYFAECAQAVSPFVDIEMLFVDFRKDQALDPIIKRARAVLAASEEFFGEHSRHRRGEICQQEAARLFVEQALEARVRSDLAFSDCWAAYEAFRTQKGLPEIDRSKFRRMVEGSIKSKFGVNFRKDVLGKNGKKNRGWRGIASVTQRGREAPD